MTEKQKADKLEIDNNSDLINECLWKDLDLLAFVCHTFAKAYPNVKKIINNHLQSYSDKTILAAIDECRCKQKSEGYLSGRELKFSPCSCERMKYLAIGDSKEMLIGFRKPPMSNAEFELLLEKV